MIEKMVRERQTEREKYEAEEMKLKEVQETDNEIKELMDRLSH